MANRSSKNSSKARFPDPGQTPGNSTGRREYSGVILLAASVFLTLCLVTFDPLDPSFNGATSRQYVNNICGLVGSHISDAFVQILGLSSFLVPPVLFIFGLNLFYAHRRPIAWSRIGCFLLLVSLSSCLLQRLNNPVILNFPPDQPGGAIGQLLHTSGLALLGNAGELILTATLAIISAAHMFNIGLRATAQRISGLGERFMNALKSATENRRARKAQIKLEKKLENRPEGPKEYHAQVQYAKIEKPKPKIFEPKPPSLNAPAESKAAASPQPQLDVDYDWREGVDAPSWERLSWLPDDVELDPLPGKSNSRESFKPQVSTLSKPETTPARTSVNVQEKPVKSVSKWTGLTYAEMKQAIDAYLAELARRQNTLDQDYDQPQPQAIIPEPNKETVQTEAPVPETAPQPPTWTQETAVTQETDASQENSGNSHRPIEVAQRADNDKSPPALGNSWKTGSDDYILPSADLLDDPNHGNRAVDNQELEINALVLEQKLEDLGVKGEIVAIHPGPVITMYELSLAAKVPLRKVLNKADDLAMALKSGSTRVVAPIPGKDTVGIEVPNLNRETVYFKEIVQSNAFQDIKDPLKIAVGKGIDGDPFATSLARMPHLLIAGATGTGKSVGLNSMILSWLMSCHPDEVKFLMVDPKKLELSYYQDIPHLIHPVVTEPEKATKVLSWAIREMDRRYDLLSKAGAKNIQGYNKMVEKARKQTQDHEDLEKLPYIVIIVDELAELMMVAAKDIEISIARLAQMARAAGIHLILATQRPSVDVITGIIKANFPARLSFQVSAKADSRTIIDTVGAEALLGKGDLLFLAPGTAKLVRLHGAFVSEKEIRNIVDFIKTQRGPVYLEEISNHVSESGQSDATAGGPCDDVKYDEAVQLVTRLGHASISLIQRHMRIGYNRAARIIEAMESEGIIGPSDGTSRPREVLAGSLDHIPDRSP